ncbi:MAG: hypothetical protein M3Z20_05310 [Chloroflexota bacterium]|nr:hypothetical protein [Chloroflexota bacterium]
MCRNTCPGYGIPSTNVTCASGTCTLSCQGDTYDVDGDPSNGCEAQYTGGAHTQETAFTLPPLSCAEINASTTPVHTIFSDGRAHASPPVDGFNPATGAAPQWWWVHAYGSLPDPLPPCSNNLDVSLAVTGSTGNCYQLTVQTSKGTWTEQTRNGVAHIDESNAYNDNTPVYFIVEKTCGTSVTEAASYTITYHL